MHVTISGHHLKTTESLQDYVHKKLTRLERHWERINQIAVVLGIEGDSKKAEATIHLKGFEVFAEAVHEDLYAAIDHLVDKLDRQVLKYKERHTAHRPHH